MSTNVPTAAVNDQPEVEHYRKFGKLVRDKRDAAGYSPVELATKAKLSDATIKFIETARHPPSRATLIRLIGVRELGLKWEDAPASVGPIPPDSVWDEAGVSPPWTPPRSGLTIATCLKVGGRPVEPGDLIGCREAQVVFCQVLALLEVKPQEDFHVGAIATLMWQLGKDRAPLLSSITGALGQSAAERVEWLARLGAAGLPPAPLYGWLRGIELALAWLRKPTAQAPVELWPEQTAT